MRYGAIGFGKAVEVGCVTDRRGRFGLVLAVEVRYVESSLVGLRCVKVCFGSLGKVC